MGLFGRKKKNVTVDFKSLLPREYDMVLKASSVGEVYELMIASKGADWADDSCKTIGWTRQMVEAYAISYEELAKTKNPDYDAFTLDVKKSITETLEFLQRVFDHVEPIFQKAKIEYVTKAKNVYQAAYNQDQSIPLVRVNGSEPFEQILVNANAWEPEHNIQDKPERKALIGKIHTSLHRDERALREFGKKVNGLVYGLRFLSGGLASGRLDVNMHKPNISLQRPI